MFKSFLKWAGGKGQLLEKLLSLIPVDGRYIEPFVGGGVVALNVPHKEIVIADVNPGLIAVWNGLKEEGCSFVEKCRGYFTETYNTEDMYYYVRSCFNNLANRTCNSSQGARFLYLNRHCFNGICRFNSKGEFNVPFGRYKKPYFPEKELCHALDVSKRMTIWKAGFMDTMNMARKGDVVYCDPPYVPINTTSNFTAYSQGGFTMLDQENLARSAQEICKRDVTVIISNNDLPITRKLYTGAEFHSIDVQRNISCKGETRGKVKELIAIYRK